MTSPTRIYNFRLAKKPRTQPTSTVLHAAEAFGEIKKAQINIFFIVHIQCADLCESQAAIHTLVLFRILRMMGIKLMDRSQELFCE